MQMEGIFEKNKLTSQEVFMSTEMHSSFSTGGVEYLDPSLEFGGSDYFHTLIEEFVKNGGVRNVSVRALPYDFRR